MPTNTGLHVSHLDDRVSKRGVMDWARRSAYQAFTLVALLAIAGIATAACSDNKSPTSPSSFPAAQSALGSGVNAPVTSPPSGQGEVTFTPPSGIPTDGGCISIGAITSPSLDWTVQALPGHATAIQIGSAFIHEPTPGCVVTNRDDVPRSLFLTSGPHLTYAPGETGTSTMSWPTDRCKDGGHFELEVWALREASSEGNSDRLSSVTVVDCGFPTPPGQDIARMGAF